MAASPVDRQALFKAVDEDPDFLNILIDTFLEDCPEYMKALRRAVEDKDAEALVEEAHGLKGAVANLRAEPAEDAARRLEEIGRSEAVEEAPEALDVLEDEIDRLRSALSEIAEDVQGDA